MVAYLEISVDQGQTFHDILEAGGISLQAAITAPSALIVTARLPVVRLGAAILMASLRPRSGYPALL